MPLSDLREVLGVALVGEPRTVVAEDTECGFEVASLWAAFTALMILAIPAGAVVPYVIYGIIGGTASCGFTLLSFASLIEAIALDGPDSQRKGLFASAYTAMEKAMLAVGGFIVAIALSASNFVQGAPLERQPGSVPITILLIRVLGRYGKPVPNTGASSTTSMPIMAQPAE